MTGVSTYFSVITLIKVSILQLKDIDWGQECNYTSGGGDRRITV
jgi:hypothetical protein